MNVGPTPGRLSPAGLVAIALTMLLSSVNQAANVTFCVLTKQQKANQNDAGPPILGQNNPYRISVVAVPSAPGSIAGGMVKPPLGPSQALVFDPVNQWFTFSAKFPTMSQLEAVAPPGNYVLALSTIPDLHPTFSLNIQAGNYPNLPHVSNFGAAQAINPSAPFTLTWDPFVGARTSDYILLLIGDATGSKLLLGSPLPGQPGALLGTATSFVIPAGTLPPNQVALCELTFFKTQTADTATYPGTVTLVGFDSFTDFAIQATAQPPGVDLPAQKRLTAIGYNAGTFTFRLVGQVGDVFEIQSSTDLRHWTTLEKVTLKATAADLSDTQAAQSPARFLRAIAPGA